MSTTVKLPDSLAKRLQEIQAMTGASDLADVIRDSLTLYAAMVEHQKNGLKPYVRNAQGKEVSIFVATAH